MLNKTRSFFATFPLLIQRTIYHGIDSERRSQSDCKICEGTFEDLYWFPITTLWTVLLHMTQVFTVFLYSMIIWDLFQIIYTLISSFALHTGAWSSRQDRAKNRQFGAGSSFMNTTSSLCRAYAAEARQERKLHARERETLVVYAITSFPRVSLQIACARLSRVSAT